VATVADLLDRADAARAAGRTAVAAELYEQAIIRCEHSEDLAAWTRALLGAASVYVFGAEPGKLPAQLYDMLVRTSDDADRARLAAALARCWVYAGQASRAVRFADEAVERAQSAGRPELIAEGLDAALAAHWGPDELCERVELATRLDNAAAHILDPDARLRAHLWGLQIACEVLDVQAVQRHLRALERLGEESFRARFFSASRRLMFDLMRGETDTAAALIDAAAAAAAHACLPDAWMVVESMKAYTAIQTGSPTTCATIAAECEEFAAAEAVTVVYAEAAYLWTAAGDTERARALVRTFYGAALHNLAQDVNWLLTLQCVLEASIATGEAEITKTAAELLTPYTGRAVFNAGAVMFHGLTDDTLARAAAVLGDSHTADRLRAQALTTYQRIGARWWHDRLAAWSPPPIPKVGPVKLIPGSEGLWLVGPAHETVPVRALRGFGYLRDLLRQPGRSISALDLVTRDTGSVLQPDLGEIIDRQALDAYRRRLTDIDQDLAEAEDWSDIGRLEALRAERAALLHELRGATGLGGRQRTTGSSYERARVAATKAIVAAIDRIATVDEALGRHLRATIHTGLNCSYQPEPDDRREWILD
jgi:tetratricopeptide (TPR) repeat protein